MNHENVDAAEVDKFSESASRWWDRDSEYKALHDINPLRLAYIEQQAGLRDKKVLDVGCGGGILSEAMAQSGAAVTGIDMSAPALSVARLHALEQGIKLDYIHTPAEQFADERAGQFDVVTCLEMLEHVPDPASVVEACARLAKPDGTVVFSTLNRNRKSWLFAIVGAENILQLLPKGTHDWNRFIKPSELASYCRQAGLHTSDLTGLTYNPLSRQYSLGRDIDVNYMMSTRKVAS